MSDDGPTLADLQRQLEELQRTVTDLESHVENGLNGGGRAPESARWDHYDEPVIEKLESGETYCGRDLVRMYRRFSTVKNPAKIKRRAKELHGSELFDGRTFVGDGEPETKR